MRPVLCVCPSSRFHVWFPLRAVWPLVRDRGAAGDPLFPNRNAYNFNRKLKLHMSALEFGRGAAFSSHAFRRVATDEVKNCESTLAAILKSGTCVSAAYCNYIRLQAGESINVTTLLIDGAGTGSDHLPGHTQTTETKEEGGKSDDGPSDLPATHFR